MKAAEVTVAGHICLDVIPAVRSASGGLKDLLVPGKLVDVGAAVTATGGAVSNTGLALHRLGIPTQLMGKVGDDLFGRAILDFLDRNGEGLSNGMIVSENEQSSYTIVISPPDVDRIFLHCTGTNDTFSSSDVNLETATQSKLFHFGYPPLMRKMYENEGHELSQLLASVKQKGLTVSLDMAKPDPDSAAGQVDWKHILQQVLPYVDFFFPSYEEILYMLDRQQYEQFHNIDSATPELLRSITEPLIQMGVAAVVLKLGENGLYVRTTSDSNRWTQTGACQPSQLESWLGREVIVPVFQVKVAGTTGAGDSTIAGFIAGLLKGLSFEDTVTSAVAVGACNVEKADATSGIVPWEQVQERLASGWDRGRVHLALHNWVQDPVTENLLGPNDQQFKTVREGLA